MMIIDKQQNFKDRYNKQKYLFTDNSTKDIFAQFNYQPIEVEKLKDAINYFPKINQKDALEDIAQLKILLERCYAGYYVFGKDFFDKAFATMEEKINELTQPIYMDDFARIINSALDGMSDYHFSIHYRNQMFRPFGRRNAEITYFNHDYELKRQEDDFYVNYEGEYIKILKINDDAPLKFIAKTINKDAEIKYSFICFGKREQNLALDVLCENNIYFKVELTANDYEATYSNYNAPMLEVSTVDNLAYVNINRLHLAQNETLQDFLDKISAIKDYPNIVLDVCDNGGGSDGIVNQIMGIVCERNANYPMSYIDLVSRAERNLSPDEAKNTVINQYEQSLKGRTNILSIKLGKQNEIKDAKKNIYVLQNRNSCSAAEMVCGIYYNLKNIIFMGDNTAGMLQIGNIQSYVLNNSQLIFNFGSSYFSLQENIIIEGKGFQPDIYFSCNMNYKERIEIMKKLIENLSN